jgi:hypothetical protein
LPNATAFGFFFRTMRIIYLCDKLDIKYLYAAPLEPGG